MPNQSSPASGAGSQAGSSTSRHPDTDLRAYPGTLTYLDLMRRNRRESVLLIGAMIMLAAALGAAIGTLLLELTSAPEPSRVGWWLGIVIGGGLGAIAAGVGALLSWFGGQRVLLGATHARRFEKHQDPELFNVVEEMAIAAGLPMPSIYIINDSALNAFATGRDPRHGAIAVTKGLRERMTRDELQAVVAHEMAHIRHLDIRFAMLIATMVGLVVVVSDSLVRAMWHGASGAGRRMRPSPGRGGRRGAGAGALLLLVIVAILAVVAPILARAIQMAYSRRREFLADAGAVELTRNPKAMASALSRLATDSDPLIETANRGMAHMFIVNPTKAMRQSHQQLNSIFASHPPIKERIARMLALLR